MAIFFICNVQATHRNIWTPVISQGLSYEKSNIIHSFGSVTPDPGTEISVVGLDFFSAVGLSEADLSSS
jgi:hypothetical protein